MYSSNNSRDKYTIPDIFSKTNILIPTNNFLVIILPTVHGPKSRKVPGLMASCKGLAVPVTAISNLEPLSENQCDSS